MVAILAGSAPGCAHRTPGVELPKPTKDQLGCFRLTVNWQFHCWPLPQMVELRPQRSSCPGARSGLEVVATVDPRLPQRPHGHWWPVDADTVKMLWGNDESGVLMQLEQNESGFFGRAVLFQDASGERADYQAELQRTACR